MHARWMDGTTRNSVGRRHGSTCGLGSNTVARWWWCCRPSSTAPRLHDLRPSTHLARLFYKYPKSHTIPTRLCPLSPTPTQALTRAAGANTLPGDMVSSQYIPCVLLQFASCACRLVWALTSDHGCASSGSASEDEGGGDHGVGGLA